MQPFDYITRAQARDAVRERLQDSTPPHFWVDDELNDLLNEGLRCWNSAALYNRARGQFTTTPGQPFYDISSVLSDGSELLLERTLTAQDLAKSIIYALVENAGEEIDALTWVGTEMFSLDDVYQAIYRRVNRFLEETGQIVTASQVSVTSGSGRIPIPTEWIDVRRAGWTTPEGSHNVLWRTSEYVADSQFSDWNTSPERPEAYSLAVSPQISVQLIPPPSDIGTLELITVNTLTTAGALNIFNDFGWVVKWGAVSDLLGQDGEAQDTERSQYGLQRWDEGIQLAKILSTVLRAEINGRTVQPCALFDLDAGVPNWQDAIGSSSNNLATPDTPAFAGPNLIALYPVPNITLAVPDGKHSILFDCVRNAILPSGDSDFIQIGREFLIPWLEYVCHLSLFKSQGEEFKNSFTGYKNIFMAAQGENARLMATSAQFPILAVQQDIDIPRKVAA